MIQFRRRKLLGPLRLTLSKRGLGLSAGSGPATLSAGADGKLRRTLRLPGAGLWDTKVMGRWKGKGRHRRDSEDSEQADAEQAVEQQHSEDSEQPQPNPTVVRALAALMAGAVVLGVVMLLVGLAVWLL